MRYLLFHRARQAASSRHDGVSDVGAGLRSVGRKIREVRMPDLGAALGRSLR